MYIPAHFAETRPDELTRIIRAHPLGMLVTSDSEPPRVLRRPGVVSQTDMVCSES